MVLGGFRQVTVMAGRRAAFLAYALISPPPFFHGYNDNKWIWNNYLSERNPVQADKFHFYSTSRALDPKSEAQLHENIR